MGPVVEQGHVLGRGLVQALADHAVGGADDFPPASDPRRAYGLLMASPMAPKLRLSLSGMESPVCRHSGCGELVDRAGGRYCEQHGTELAAVLGMLDEMRHVPGQTLCSRGQ